MAHVSKKKLQEALNDSINAPANRKAAIKSAYADLVDTTLVRHIPHPDISLLTTSGSGVVNMEVVQPANSVITELMVLCTADTSAPAAQKVGLRIGTTPGGTEILGGTDTQNSQSFGTGITVVKKGQGCSTHPKFATQLSGSELTLKPQTATTHPLLATAERTIHIQVSASAASAVNGRFDTNTGAFKPIVHFEKF